VVNLDPLSVTLHKNTKLANAKLIREEAISAISQQDTQRAVTEIILQSPLPNDITDIRKEQFLSLMANYSDVIAQSPNDLGCTSFTASQIQRMHHLSDNRPDESPSHAEKQFRPCYKIC